MKKIYTKEQWNIDGTLSVEVGQEIDSAVYWQLLESVPPTTHTAELFQVGEPYNHDYTGKPLYATFKNVEGAWVFCGNYCRKGETVNRIALGQVDARRVIGCEFEGIDNQNRPIFKGPHGWRFGTTEILFPWDAEEVEVMKKFQSVGDSLRSKFFYFGNKFGCEPSGEELYDGDKVVIYWSNGDMII